MNANFTQGYRYVKQNIDGIIGADIAESYVSKVQESIDTLTAQLNDVAGTTRNVDQLKGNVFELWHALTFNIDAAFKETGEQARAPRSNGLASPDIETSWGECYGLKDYATAAKSAREQAISYREYFKAAQAFEDHCQKQGLDPSALMHKAIYEGQSRLIPEDQVEGAQTWLRRKILEEQSKRQELVEKYQETLDRITDRVKSPKGAESTPLSERGSSEVAAEARDGKFDSKKYGISTEALISYEQVLKRALRAGTSAAVLTAVMRVAPVLAKLIAKAVHNDYISADEFRAMGLDCLSASSQSFIRGSIAATITTSFRAGLAGQVAKTIDPVLIGTATVVAFNAISNSVRMVKGDMKQAEFANACIKDVFIAACSYGGALAFQSIITVPIVAAILGNIVGGIAGAFTYSAYTNLFLSFCAETGFTFLGVVDQDYELPDSVLKDMGLDLVIEDVCSPDVCVPDVLEPDVCEPDILKPDTVTPYVIRRGVIGINRIGFSVQ